MKVLFLDIDGVCNCEDTFTKDPNAYFPIDLFMTYLVGKITIFTGCEVVLSSSWRHHKESVEFINKRIVTLLDTTGNEPHDNTRPSGVENCQRGREIKAWLDKHPEVTKYAILDDDSDMLPEQLPNFFKTSWKIGITAEIADKIIRHLGLSKTKPKPHRKINVV